ncbi:MAG: hypothetical protein NAOJABEB_02973 [Steroidobacteraceae bacterium]|nr:hypothetical protein [Steroidobacteraceae bacterium]
MGELSVSIDQRAVTAAFLKAPGEIGDALRRTVELGAVDFEGGVVAHTPVGATGHLRQSITQQVSGSGLLIEGRVYSTDVPIKVVSVEHGRKPGRMPPRGPIELWVRRKLGGDAALVFLIQRAIGRRGTRGAHMFQQGFDSQLGRVQGRIAELMAAVRRVI